VRLAFEWRSRNSEITITICGRQGTVKLDAQILDAGDALQAYPKELRSTTLCA